ncbi:MAG TPA: bacterial transcriptional activator domain-containing protein [Ideonella sp.]|uniref:bacterial transcriptional activator domain-containing protein n=1 Tax=Ideonella sp. TaxID=1929293 RepID=UPI002D10BEEE|nr:bacterial transcriptional activator domain-containing protein [Ideonella sp.]HSI50344.1 bacterial transcriptional activator domain-containing protein [Ideonella sp.]
MFCSLIKLILHQPLLDLVERPQAEFFANAAARATTALLDDLSSAYPLWIQRRGTPGLRDMLLRETRPVAVALDYTRWEAIQTLTNRWQALDIDARVKLARVLLQVGAYDRLGALFDSDVDMATEPRLAMLNVSVRVGMYRAGCAELPVIKPLQEACERALDASPSEEIEVAAALRSFLLALTYGGDADVARARYERAVSIAKRLEIATPTFRRVLMTSCLWRATAMWPHARGDLDQMTAEMTRCEALANAATPTDATEAFLAHENLFSVHESRTKERLACRDIDGAVHHAARLVALFPFDATAHIELGEVLLRAGRPAEAAVHYELAAEYGPPGSAIAWFMAGEAHAACAAGASREARALTAYLASQRIDPLAVSAVQRAADSSRRGIVDVEHASIGNWCADWLDEAQAMTANLEGASV